MRKYINIVQDTAIEINIMKEKTGEKNCNEKSTYFWS